MLIRWMMVLLSHATLHLRTDSPLTSPLTLGGISVSSKRSSSLLYLKGQTFVAGAVFLQEESQVQQPLGYMLKSKCAKGRLCAGRGVGGRMAAHTVSGLVGHWFVVPEFLLGPCFPESLPQEHVAINLTSQRPRPGTLEPACLGLPPCSDTSGCVQVLGQGPYVPGLRFPCCEVRGMLVFPSQGRGRTKWDNIRKAPLGVQ